MIAILDLTNGSLTLFTKKFTMLQCNLKMKITIEKKGIFSDFIHKIWTNNFSESYFHYNSLKVSIKSANNH